MTPGSDPDVPPSLQCDYPSCEQVVNPTARGPNACPAHHPDNDTHKAEQPGASDLNPTEKATSTTSTPTPGDDTGPSTVSISPDCAQTTLDDAITWVHSRIDDEILHHHSSNISVAEVAGDLGECPDEVQAILNDISGVEVKDPAEPEGDERATISNEKSVSYAQLYLEARGRSDRDSALLPLEEVEPVFEEAGFRQVVDSLRYHSDWTVWTPDDRDQPLVAYTPDLAGDTSEQRHRLAELLAESGAGTDRFINVLNGQKASFDTANDRPPDHDAIQGNYGVKGGRGAQETGPWLLDIDVDDYDEAKSSNPRIEELRKETTGVASAHTTVQRPGHLYVLVDGDPRQVIRDYLNREVENPQASFGELRIEQQYVVGPGSEVLCECDRCQDPESSDHFGRYQLATEKPPVVWSEEEFREFLEEDPALEPAPDRPGSSDSGLSGGTGGGSLDGDTGTWVQFAKEVDEYVSKALRQVRNPDDRSQADSLLARSLAPWLSYDESAIEEVLDNKGSSKWQARGDSYHSSVLDYATDRRSSVSAYDSVPYWALVEYAVSCSIVDREDLVYRDSDSGDVVGDRHDHEGDTYQALPDVEDYNATLDAIEDLGIDHGRDRGTPIEHTTRALSVDELLEKDSTLSRREAWRAAEAITPAELDEKLTIDSNGEHWVCPSCGDAIQDVVRAHAVAGETLQCCQDTFDDPAAYDRHYDAVREDHGAPLLEYIPPTQAIEDMDKARGAVEALRGWHIVDSLESGLTNENPYGEDAVATIDPTWEDSESGERIVLFSSGLFWCREHEQIIWPLKVVGLEQGLIDSEEDWLSGDDFLRAYAIARTQYDAPLPPITWNDAEEAPEPMYLPVLPNADELLGEGVLTDPDGLEAAREAVSDLYRDIASEPGSGNTVISTLPATGKSYAVQTQADQFPTLYTAKRKELRQEAALRAASHDISHMHAPTLGENRPPKMVLQAAVSHVREHSRDVLRKPDLLLAAVEHVYESIDETWDTYEAQQDVDEDSDESEDDGGVDLESFGRNDPCPDCGRTFETLAETRSHIDACESGREDIDLERETCECGDGEHGPEWQLAIWVARELGIKPREIHVRGETTFGEDPPCTEDGDCSYTRAWERATDPDAPIDLLIGHPVHAYVGGARVQPRRTEEGNVWAEDRVIAMDEYPSDAFTSEFDSGWQHHARWLAQCLDGRIEDITDLTDHREELWHDEMVVNWLDGAARPEIYEALETCRRQDEDEDADDPDWEALRDADWNVHGDLAELVDRAITVAAHPDHDAEELLDSAMTALQGGIDGVEVLVSGAKDGYAHPDALWLLTGFLAPVESEDELEEGTDDDDWRDGVTVQHRQAEYFDFGNDNGSIKSVTIGGHIRMLLDRDMDGALLLAPPHLRSNTVVGLDATARTELWERAVGSEFDTADIHETPEQRKAFLRDVLNLKVVQSSLHVNTYSGNPSSKNFGDDIELVREVASSYSGQQLAQDRLSTTSSPAVVTTKTVEQYISDDLYDAGADTVEHYGDLIGSNRLDDYNVGVILGAEHYGHSTAEKWALLAGEEFEVTGHGNALDYKSSTANALLKRMREDKVMQSIMRFSRDEEGAVVFAHTSALREDLPVVKQADIVEAWTGHQQTVANAAADLAGESYTVSDVLEDDRINCHRRTVRRILNEFTDLGYLHRDGGHTNEYETIEDPGTGQVDLPAGVSGGGPDLELPDGDSEANSGQTGLENINTRFVWSCDLEEMETDRSGAGAPTLGPPRAEHVSGSTG